MGLTMRIGMAMHASSQATATLSTIASRQISAWPCMRASSQVISMLSTIASFAADTAGAFNRDWYITGGFMLISSMLFDLIVISCLIQGWKPALHLSRIVFAPAALTQYEMDKLYAGDGASTYVVDRLQMVTKFVVMCYICSAAIPLLYVLVLLVLALAISIDETNLLCVLRPAPQVHLHARLHAHLHAHLYAHTHAHLHARPPTSLAVSLRTWRPAAAR